MNDENPGHEEDDPPDEGEREPSRDPGERARLVLVTTTTVINFFIALVTVIRTLHPLLR